MTKFILPGFLLILLASLMKPTLSSPENFSLKKVNKTVSYVDIGNTVHNARVSRGLSSNDLAYMLNLSNLEIEKIEANEVVPSKELVDKISVALKININAEK
jgi:ribosome-binding protein aMBF1 (putative translation factor)